MKKLLLIDDDPFSQKMLEDMFRNEWKIVNETTPEEIHKLINASDFKLVLLNASIRKNDGEVVFRAIHSQVPDLPIVVYTNASQVKLGRSLLKQGAFWNLTMPLNTDDLAHIMKLAASMDELQNNALTTQRDFTQLEEGIARMFTPLKGKFPEEFTFEQDDLIQGIVDLLADILQVEKASLMLLNRSTGELRIKAAKGLTPYVIQNSVRKIGEGIAGWVAKEGKPLLIKDVQNDPQFSESPFYHQYTTRSLVCVPLKVEDRVIGVLSANNHVSGKPFDEKDLYLATIFSHLLLLTLHNAQLHYDRERNFMREAQLSGLNRKIAATLEPKVVFHILLNECTQIFQGDAALLFNLEEKGVELDVYYLMGNQFTEMSLPANLIRQWIAWRSEPALRAGEPGSKEFEILRNILKQEIRCWISAPVVLQDKLSGSIELVSSDPTRFKEEDKLMLFRISQQASLAINNARLYLKLLNSIKEISDARKEVDRVRRGQFL